MTSELLSLPILLCALGAYLLGSIPFGYLLALGAGEGDIRQIGSGNIGATNVLRTGRYRLAAATLFLDGFKGFLAVLIVKYALDDAMQVGLAVAAVSVVIGHCFPIWLGFRGGKGVATGLGAFFALCWPVALGCCILWLAAAKFSGISSVGALLAFTLAPVVMPSMIMQPIDSPVPLATLLLTLIIMLRHKHNIYRLINGSEPHIRLDSPPQGKIEL